MNLTNKLLWAEFSDALGSKASFLVKEIYITKRREQRAYRLRRAAESALMAGAGGLLMNLGQDRTLTVIGLVAVLLAGFRAGEDLYKSIDARVEITDVFVLGPGSSRFWANLNGKYRKTTFLEFLEEHGPASFVPADSRILKKVLNRDTGWWGKYPAITVLYDDFMEAGFNDYVYERFDGAVEMSQILCRTPKITTIDDLHHLFGRLQKRS